MGYYFLIITNDDVLNIAVVDFGSVGSPNLLYQRLGMCFASLCSGKCFTFTKRVSYCFRSGFNLFLW